MKTAISVPNELFDRAERIAHHLGLKRSQLYVQALEQFLNRYDPEATTAAFDAIYATESSELDPLLWEMQLASMESDEW